MSHIAKIFASLLAQLGVKRKLKRIVGIVLSSHFHIINTILFIFVFYFGFPIFLFHGMCFWQCRSEDNGELLQAPIALAAVAVH